MNVRVFFLTLLLATSVQASPMTGAVRWVPLSTLQMPDTLRARQSAFSLSNQRAGPCIQVARNVFEGFKQLGRIPSYIQFTTTGTQRGANLIGFDLVDGARSKTVQISQNAVHYAVQIEDRVYDAMTGPAGMALSEYMGRLQSPGRISMQVVSQLP